MRDWSTAIDAPRRRSRQARPMRFASSTSSCPIGCRLQASTCSLQGVTGQGMSKRELNVVMFAIAMTLFLSALDQTIVSTALPTMVGELGGLDQYSWVVTSYMLTSTIGVPLFGKI